MNFGSPIRVVIVEDQPVIRKDAEALVKKLKHFVVVGSYASMQEALREIPGSRADLLLLDINLGDGTAFDILEQLPHNDYKVIFMTGYREHAIRAIKFGALDYVLKPINETEFYVALNKVFQPSLIDDANPVVSNNANLDNSQRLKLSSKHRLQIVDFNEIIYCQSDSGHTTFYLNNNRTITTTKCIKEYEDLLIKNKFIRIHKSFIVNRLYIRSYEHTEDYLILRNGLEIPVAARRKEVVMNAINGND
jgi:two-component system LytT family response regulator